MTNWKPWSDLPDVGKSVIAVGVKDKQPRVSIVVRHLTYTQFYVNPPFKINKWMYIDNFTHLLYLYILNEDDINTLIKSGDTNNLRHLIGRGVFRGWLLEEMNQENLDTIVDEIVNSHGME